MCCKIALFFITCITLLGFRMSSQRVKLYIVTMLICLKCCEALFYTNSKENDYPRIGKRPSYLDQLNKFGYSQIQDNFFTNKRGQSEEYVHSLREALMPSSEETYDIIDGKI